MARSLFTAPARSGTEEPASSDNPKGRNTASPVGERAFGRLPRCLGCSWHSNAIEHSVFIKSLTKRFPPPPYDHPRTTGRSAAKHVSLGIDLELDRCPGPPIIESGPQFVCSHCFPAKARRLAESERSPRKLGRPRMASPLSVAGPRDRATGTKPKTRAVSIPLLPSKESMT